MFRKWFRISLIAFILQLGAYGAYLLNVHWSINDTLTIIIAGTLLILSLAAGIILPLKWCRTTKDRLIMIFILPTNYTIPLLIILYLRVYAEMVSIMSGLPKNFG